MGAGASSKPSRAAPAGDAAQEHDTRPADPTGAPKKADRLRMLRGGGGSGRDKSSSRRLLGSPSVRKLLSGGDHGAPQRGVSKTEQSRSRYSLLCTPRFSLVAGGGGVCLFKYDATVNLLPLNTRSATAPDESGTDLGSLTTPVAGHVEVLLTSARQETVGVLVAGQRRPDGSAPKTNVLHLFLAKGKYASTRMASGENRFVVSSDGAVLSCHPNSGTVLLYTTSARAGYHVERLASVPLRFVAAHLKPASAPASAVALTSQHVLAVVGGRLVVWKRDDPAELGSWELADPLRELSAASSRRLQAIRGALTDWLVRKKFAFLGSAAELRALAAQCDLGPLAASAIRRHLWAARPREAGAKTRRRLLSSNRPAYLFATDANAVMVERHTLAIWLLDLNSLHSWTASNFRPAHFSSMIQSLAHRQLIEPRHPRFNRRMPDHVAFVECARAHQTLAAVLLTFQRGATFEKWAAGTPAAVAPRRVELQIYDLTSAAKFNEPPQSLVLDEAFSLERPAAGDSSSDDDSGDGSGDSGDDEAEEKAAGRPVSAGTGLRARFANLLHHRRPSSSSSTAAPRPVSAGGASAATESLFAPGSEIVPAPARTVQVAPAQPKPSKMQRRTSVPTLSVSDWKQGEEAEEKPEIGAPPSGASARSGPAAASAPTVRRRLSMADAGSVVHEPAVMFDLPAGVAPRRGPKMDVGAPDIGLLKVALLGRRYAAVLHTIGDASEILIFFIGQRHPHNNEPIARLTDLGLVLDIQSVQSRLVVLNGVGGVVVFSVVQQKRKTIITRLFNIS